MSARVLCIGGEDHRLRIPFLLALRARGFDVTAAGTGDPAPFLRAGLDFVSYRFDRFVNPFADWEAIGALSKLVVQAKPELVQSFDTKPNLLVPLAARKLGVRVVRTINGLGWVYSSRSPLALAIRPLYCALHRLAARSTAATLFQNGDDQAFFEGHGMVGSGTSRLIPGSGIDIDSFDKAMAARQSSVELRNALGLGDCEVVITVTRITRQKGIATLLEAAALVHAARPQVRFLLVGPRQSEGPMAVPQAEIDRHAPYVIATGARTDIPALLGLADVFAFPTEYREGVPRVLLEAALARLPIVTTKMPGCSDVVEHGWSGYLVPPRRPEPLATRILELLRDREAAGEMGERASEHVRRDFGLDLTVARYAQVYAELLDPAARPASAALRHGAAPR